MPWGLEQVLHFRSYLAFLEGCFSTSMKFQLVVERAAEPILGVLESPDVKRNSRPLSLRTLKQGRKHFLCLTVVDLIDIAKRPPVPHPRCSGPNPTPLVTKGESKHQLRNLLQQDQV